MTYEESISKINNFKILLTALKKCKNVSDSEYKYFEKNIQADWDAVIEEYQSSRNSL